MKRLFALMLIGMMALVSCTEEDVDDVTTASITKVSLSKTSLSFWVGDDYTMLTAAVNPSDVEIESTIWSVSNDVPEGCVTVNSYGQVYPVSEGTATVTVTVTAMADGSTASADCQVTVGLVDVTSITLSSDTLNLYKDDMVTLTTSVKPVNASDYGVTWSIKEATPSGCIELNTKGKVTAVTTGTAIVMATSETNPDVTAECVVNVVVLPESISLDESVLTLYIAGAGDAYKTSHQFVVTMSPDDVTDESVVWAIENTNEDGVLYIDENGYLTAGIEGNGEVVVTSVSNPSLSARCYVDVITATTSIGLSKTELSLSTEDDSSVDIEVSYNPDYTANKEVTWLAELLDVDGEVVEGGNVDCLQIEANSATTVKVSAVTVDGEFEYGDVVTVRLTAIYTSDTSLTASCVITLTNDTEPVIDEEDDEDEDDEDE